MARTSKFCVCIFGRLLVVAYHYRGESDIRVISEKRVGAWVIRRDGFCKSVAYNSCMTQSLVRQGWATKFDVEIAESIRRYLESYLDTMAGRFIHEQAA